MPDSKNNLLPLSKLLQRKERLRTMRLSLIEGAIAMVMVAMTQAFYVPYFNALGASTLQIGLAVSLPALAASLIQIYTPAALQKAGSRKKLVALMVFLQAICFIPFALMALVHSKWAIWGAIGFSLLMSTAGNLSGASWADWMGDVVPKKWHGKYFANRNRLLSLIQLPIAVTASFLLDRAAGKVMLMFSSIWLACFAARLISSLLFTSMYEPPVPKKQLGQTGGFFAFIKALPRTDFGNFTLATSLLSIGVNFSAPFLAVHMLRNLKLSYVEYTILIVSVTVAIVGFLGLWGRIIDRLGSVVALRFCALGITLIPLPWVITDDYFILLGTQIFAGFCWAGFNLAVFVHFLNSKSSTTRVSSISYFYAINFFCVFIGATLGGLLGPHLPIIAGFQLRTIFVVSVLIRIMPAMLFQTIKIKKRPQKFTAIEKLFFDPTINIRPAITRSIFRLFNRDI